MILTPLQISPIQIFGGFLLIATLSSLLANTAAYYVTGESQLPRAILPGVVMSLVGLTASVLPILATVALALALDYAAVYVAFRLDRRRTAMVTVMHFTLIVVVAYVVNSSLAIYQTSPL